MSSALPFFGKTKVKIAKDKNNFVELDVSIQEGHTFAATATEHPVEAGANVSDHVRPNADKLKISGLVSNTPLTDNQISRNPIRAEQAFGILRDWLKRGEQLTVSTTLDTYETMVLTELSVTRDKEKTNAAFMDMSFTKIVLAESQFATVAPISETKATQKKQNVGKQPTKTVEPRRSLALKGIKALTGL